MTWATGQTAVVTGAARGIGAACVRRFASDGARVIAVDLETVGLQELATSLRAQGAEIETVQADVSRETSWATIADVAHRSGQHVSILHSNAYVHRSGLPDELAPDQWELVMGVNVKAVFWAVRTFLDDLRATRGTIITTSSVHARFGLPGYSAYAASKGALDALTRQLAVELGPEVRVNSVLPGPIRTRAMAAEAERAASRATALDRIGRPEEVAAAVSFLASPQASFITGVNLFVDGGWSVKKDSP